MSPRGYLRTGTHRRFDGESWESDASPAGPLKRASRGDAAFIEQVITIEAWRDSILPSAYAPVDVLGWNGVDADARMLSGMILTLSRPPGAGDRYTVVSQAPGAYPQPAETDPGACRELPPSVTEGTVALASRLAESRAGLDALLAAIRSHFAANYRYEVEYPALTTSDPVHEFLFKTRTGSCTLFATAATILLRIRGYPARLASGFLPSELDRTSGDYLVRARHAHAWCEVHSPGEGWVLFDPTPSAGQKPAEREQPKPKPRPTPTPSSRGSRALAEYRKGVAKKVAGAAAAVVSRFRQPEGRSSVTAIGFAAAIAVILTLTLRWRSRTSGRTASKGSRTSPRSGHWYRRTLEKLADRGLPKRSWETPYEYLARVQGVLGGVRGLEELTTLYLRARYAAQPLPEDDETRARDLSDALSLGLAARPMR